MSCHFVPTQRSNPRLLDWQVDSWLLNHQGSLAWPCRDKKTPLLNLEEELIMEAWHLLEKDKDVLLSLPTFPLIIKLYWVLGVWHPLAVWFVSLTRAYPSISLLIYHFASHWILSVLRQKGLWSWNSLEARNDKLDSSVFSLSFSSVFSTMNSSFCGASSKMQQLLVSSIIISLGINSESSC